MGRKSRHHPPLRSILALAERQHGLVTRAQLLDAGLSRNGIEHRLGNGRLHAVFRGVYAVGHPRLTREGRWLAAVLACGEGAALSYLSAAAVWAISERAIASEPHVSVPTRAGRTGPPGMELHRTQLSVQDLTTHNAIPLTSLSRTLADLAGVLTTRQLKSALRQAERQHRLDLSALRASLDAFCPTAPKHARLKSALDAYVPGTADTEA